ncbi:MAG: REP-associated tyrosine transposase [Gammaproteobacteria bacterium]
MPYNNLRKGRLSEAERGYFITTELADRKKRYFDDFLCARLIVMNMKLLHEDQTVYSLAWVVMPDHVHWLFQLESTATLSEVVKTFKARIAHRVNAYLGKSGPLWQKNLYDHALRKEEDVWEIARYIVANLLRAGLVKHIGDYPHWDAIRL